MRGTITATGILLVVLAAYVLSCIIRPFRDCWMCSGRGHFRSKSNRKLSRPCWWCDRTGKRLRLAWRVWNHVRRAHHDAAAGAKIGR